MIIKNEKGIVSYTYSYFPETKEYNNITISLYPDEEYFLERVRYQYLTYEDVDSLVEATGRPFIIPALDKKEFDELLDLLNDILSQYYMNYFYVLRKFYQDVLNKRKNRGGTVQEYRNGIEDGIEIVLNVLREAKYPCVGKIDELLGEKLFHADYGLWANFEKYLPKKK
jgi:hypothetical protein